MMKGEERILKSKGTLIKGEPQKDYKSVKEIVVSLGADIFGVASAERYVEEFPDKPSPFTFVPDAKSIIVFGMAFLKGTMNTVLRPELSGLKSRADESVAGKVRPQGAERYFFGAENRLLMQETEWVGYLLTRRLEQNGFPAFYFAAYKQDPRYRTALFYMTPALYLAGMGTMGLNCSIMNPEYGPRIFANCVITTLELPPDEPLEQDICTRCNKCVDACPPGALDGEGWKNVYRCAAYGCCGTCLAICPVGK
jgi:epoxyqueuosine reductase QueG